MSTLVVLLFGLNSHANETSIIPELDVKLSSFTDERGLAVSGIVENMTNATIENASVQFTIYDASGIPIDSPLVQHIKGLGPHGIWRFARYPSKPFTSYKLFKVEIK